MSEICSLIKSTEPVIKSAVNRTRPQDDVVIQKDACASKKVEHEPKIVESDIPPKKRKTRRGKSKRKHPYIESLQKSNKVIKPEAPHNSNQFLLEDHGNIEELDEKLKFADGNNSEPARIRDSSFSVDSEEEFYSSPDDEEQFLRKDFDDQYESVQTERLHSMSKTELIQEYLQLESKVEALMNGKKINNKENQNIKEIKSDLQDEIKRLAIENETLKRENDVLKNKTSMSCSYSEDSETDSSDSCSSTSTSESNCSPEPIDYSQTNGHSSASVETV